MPSIGIRKWIQINMDAGERGAIMAESNSIIEIPFEDLLSEQVREVRTKLGIPPHKCPQYENADGYMASKDWMRGSIGKKAESGYGAMENAKEYAMGIKEMVEAGIPIRTIMSSDVNHARIAYDMFARGEDIKAVEEVLT